MKYGIKLLFLLLLTSWTVVNDAQEKRSIDISRIHLQYWEYEGNPLLLLGGSDEDNLFQHPNLEEQLELLAAAGGNYVRNTMSSRDSGNVWPFGRDDETGKYDLNRWNERYWDRFEKFLRWTEEKEIFVQIEVWATFDFYRENWDVNPFNPKNNINYSSDRTKLPESVPTHPTWCDNPFFWSIPSQHNNMPVLQYQQKYVDQLLSFSLEHGHVLYCIDNETSVTADWGRFWANYIRKKAAEAGTKVHVTEMWDPWDLNHISHRESFDHPEIYSFVEISQNNHQRGENQWINGISQIERLKQAGNLRPVTNVKTYGATGGRHGGGTDNGIASFIRSSLFGSSAVRFHRPPSGLGLSDTARSVIRSMRMASDRIDFFHAEPHNELLVGRKINEAYCRAIPGSAYLVYFPGEGEVELRLKEDSRIEVLEELEVLKSSWSPRKPNMDNNRLKLTSRGKHMLYLIILS